MRGKLLALALATVGCASSPVELVSAPEVVTRDYAGDVDRLAACVHDALDSWWNFDWMWHLHVQRGEVWIPGSVAEVERYHAGSPPLVKFAYDRWTFRAVAPGTVRVEYRVLFPTLRYDEAEAWDVVDACARGDR